jgi:arginase
MRITLIEVPYDCGRFGERMGSGPLELVATLPPSARQRRPRGRGAAGAAAGAFLPRGRGRGRLAARGAARGRRGARERAAARRPLRQLRLRGARRVAALAAAGRVLWLDAHADFNTPETSPSGFFDGTCLATLAGRAWPGVSRRFDGFTPVAEERRRPPRCARARRRRARDAGEQRRRVALDTAVRDDAAALPAALDVLSAEPIASTCTSTST